MPWLESWQSEQPWHCDVCDTTFYGKELTYIPGVMCEDSNCPGTQERRDVEVVPLERSGQGSTAYERAYAAFAKCEGDTTSKMRAACDAYQLESQSD